MNKALRAAVGVGAICGALAFAGTAEAKIVLQDGKSFTIEADATIPDVAKNQLFNHVYGTADGVQLTGWLYGEENNGTETDGFLKIVGGTHSIKFEYLGAEAGNTNEFFVKGAFEKATPGGGINKPNPFENLVTSDFGNGAIDFRFESDGVATAYAQNGDDSSLFCTKCSIFVLFLGANGQPLTDQSGKEGFIVDIFFDDGGTNDNHDDMVIRMTATPVPVPAALPIIGAALAGFGFAGWRSKRRTA